MKHSLTLFCLVITVLGPAWSCKGGPKKSVQSGKPVAVDTPTLAELETSLADYESLRAALAGDRLSEISLLAAKLAATSRGAQKGQPAPVAQRLTEISAAALLLEAPGSSEVRRKAFGEVSRAFVALLTENEALAQGRYIFQCPMAQGYKKWVQTKEKLENPYMGGRMLRCGSASTWKP